MAPSPLDAFIPQPDVREHHETVVAASAASAMAVVRTFRLESIPAVRFIFRLREILLGARPAPREPRPFLEDMQSIGWQCLLDRPESLFVGGAACQPWLADVVFKPIPAESFVAFHEPGLVKIAWTLEVEPLGPDRCRLSTETRVVAADGESRTRFRKYWRWARFGIILIRLLMLPAIRRQAEAKWRSSLATPRQ
jgi:hypothetical protein